jgi:hypothetical protein
MVDSRSVMLGTGGIIFILIIIVFLFFFFSTSKKKAVVTSSSPSVPSTKTVEETPPTPPSAGGCPATPYTYCSTDTIQNVYISSGCTPSSQLVRKLISEGKLTGEDDPKIINCSENPDLCTAAGIRSYPSVICGNAPTSVYEGYCP